MIKAILIDDERSSLESLSIELKAYCSDVQVIATFNSPQEALEQLPSLTFDLLFLDIEMPGMNGFELLQALPATPFDVIFVTAYDQFVIRAFDFDAQDYLLKPIRKTKLISAVQKVKEKRQHQFDPQQLFALLQNIGLQQGATGGLQKIALPIGEGYSLIPVNDISHLAAESNYTWVHMIQKEKHLVSKTLKEIEALLQFSHFFRSHKSYLVNLNHVERYVRGQGGYLVISNGTQIPVSRSQKAELINLLKGN